MLASTPTKDYVALRNPSTMSPSYRTRYCTPPRSRKDATKHDSLLLSPSPLRQRLLFPIPKEDTDVAGDLFMQSPFKSSAPAQFHAPYPTKPQPIAVDDDDGSIFLSSSSTSPTIPASLSQPLRTPVKQSFGFPTRPVLSEKQLNTTPLNARPALQATDVTRVGVGTKRKQSCRNVSTPLRPHTLSPLKAAASKTVDPRATTCFMFDRLAPLEAPKFITRTPQTKAETEAYLRRQTATLTKLKLADLGNSDDEFSLHPVRNLDDEMEGFAPSAARRDSGYKLVANRSKDKEEVVEVVSPGGHVIKRRARSRPVSAELFETALRPSSSPTKRFVTGTKFPSTRSHTRTSSGSSMETTSPRPRRRVGGASHPYIRSVPSPQPPRAPMNRVSSGSSASLFFGPSIPSSDLPSRNRATSSATATSMLCATRPKVNHRHSYSGFGDDLKAWNTIQARAVSPSPESSPARASCVPPRRPSLDDDEDAFFNSSSNLSFQVCVTEGTPSPRTRRLDPGTLQRKYRPRDSGVVISDDEDEPPLNSSNNSNILNIEPRTSTSDGSLNSDDGLITPGIVPDLGSGWPSNGIFIHEADDTCPRQDSEIDVDAFIIRTLSTASKGANDGVKKAPGTPVKKARTTFLGADRPWQSAIAPKVGLRYDLGDRTSKIPRKSLPAVLSRKMYDEQSTESEREDDSPIASRGKYSGIGLGRPQPPLLREGIPARTRLLMRRSSSSAFSSGSDSTSLIGTPTRARDNGKDFIPLSMAALKRSPSRTASNSSTDSNVIANSSIRRSQQLHSERSARSSSLARRLIKPSEEEQPGRFQRDFEEIDELGSGEFGKVIKVQSKTGKHPEVYAIKKSKQFEGPKHRLRLREEVEILKHLSQRVAIQGRHPNVLGYVDSWEEDEALYIQTELCESGSLARFLWEYGRVFPRLDEARVWKIITELSNGLYFIHEAGVIHLDLKPSNIFLTKDGRFKIGDFGMASLWPRKPSGSFEREGDKLYLAPEVLQGQYGKAADMFSFGMTILETASNIVVPDQGEAWHRLRQEDFSQVDLDDSPELLELIKQLMRTDPASRVSARDVHNHPIVSRARAIMERTYDMAMEGGTSVFVASPLASVSDMFLAEILCRRSGIAMDTSP